MPTARADAPLIAVIDDDVTFLEVLRGLFEDEGYRVVTGSVPDEALILLRAHVPDIAVLDLSFGETREAGLALLGALRVEPQFAHLPVLVVSGASDYLAVHADAFAALGAVTLAKPVDVQILLDSVARFVPAPSP